METVYNFNPQVLDLSKSPTLKITALAKKMRKEGRNVINFAGGEPDFDTPDFIKEAAKKALDEGFTKYTPSAGLPDLKQRIVRKLQKENSLSVTEENILVTSGAKFAVFLGIFASLEEGSEVILPAPYWVSYPEMVKMTKGTLRVLNTSAEDSFKITPRKLAEAVTSRTRLIVLNYPCNPTGATYTEDELRGIWEVIKKTNMYILSDEIYEHILFDGRAHVSFGSLDEQALARTITVNGFSKCFSMTGWRLGYIAGPADFIKEASKVLDHTTSCANSITQKAACAALEGGGQWTPHIRKIFQERRDVLYQSLKEEARLGPMRPQGTFYLFCDISPTGLSALDFASRLLDEYEVAVIPSEGFGVKQHIRISFATSTENIIAGAARIKKFASQL